MIPNWEREECQKPFSVHCFGMEAGMSSSTRTVFCHSATMVTRLSNVMPASWKNIGWLVPDGQMHPFLASARMAP